MYKNIALLIVSCYAPLYSFQANFASTNTYKGEEITAESLLKLTPQAPQDITSVTQDWLTAHPQLAHHLSGVDAPLAGDIDIRRSYHKKVYGDFKDAGYPTLTHSVNWVLDLHPDWLMKVSGEPNRHENLTTYFGKNYGEEITPEELEHFKSESGVTFQTISRLAYYLRAKEVVEAEGLSIKIPETYLVHIPGQSLEICDANYVVVEKKVQGTFTYLEDHEKAVEEQTILDLVKLIGYTALWNHTKNILVDKENAVHYVDLEQPNRHNAKASEFFHRVIEVHRSNVQHGWTELDNQIIKKYVEQQKVLNQRVIDITNLIALKQALQEQIQATWE